MTSLVANARAQDDFLSDVIAPPGWFRDASCAEHPNVEFFDGPTADAKAICAGCIVREECESYARDHGIMWGVWGGLDVKERRARNGPA